MKIKSLAFAGLGVLALATAAFAISNQVRVTESSDMRCISSNGYPDHSIGQFPNSGNPHSISAQSIQFCVTATPEKTSRATEVETVGIAENGVIIRPGTADYYDASSPRGFSRDGSSGWNLEGMGASELLGLDQNNAHVDQRGLYHYHGVPPTLAATVTNEDTRIGWAADGFEIHYVGDNARPSYQLKSGTRSTAPGGTYDGTYNEDFEYVRGLGNLDECNGAMLNGTYTYFATDTYPFYPRCLYGSQVTVFR